MKIRVILVIIILLSIELKTYSQAALVHDPVNLAEAINTTAEIFNLGQTMNKLKEIQDNIEKIKESVDWLQNTRSVVQLIILIEETICILENLKINMDIALDLFSPTCLDNFEYKLNFNKLLLSIDMINSVLSQGTKMDQAQRWQIIGIVLDNFTQSQLNFNAINKHYQKKIYAKQFENKLKSDNQKVVNIISTHYE